MSNQLSKVKLIHSPTYFSSNVCFFRNCGSRRSNPVPLIWALRSGPATSLMDAAWEWDSRDSSHPPRFSSVTCARSTVFSPAPRNQGRNSSNIYSSDCAMPLPYMLQYRNCKYCLSPKTPFFYVLALISGGDLPVTARLVS